MKRIIYVLFAFTLTISTLPFFNATKAHASSLDEKIQTYCGKEGLNYSLDNGNDNPKVKEGETINIKFDCNGKATTYNAYIKVLYPVQPTYYEYTYGSKSLTEKKNFKVKVKHTGYAQVVFTLKDANGKKLTFNSKEFTVYSSKSPKISGIEGSTDFMDFKKKSTFTITSKQKFYAYPITEYDEINFNYSAQLLNSKKKKMSKKYVKIGGYQTYMFTPPKKGTYYVKLTQKNVYTGKSVSKTCKLIVK